MKALLEKYRLDDKVTILAIKFLAQLMHACGSEEVLERRTVRELPKFIQIGLLVNLTMKRTQRGDG